MGVGGFIAQLLTLDHPDQVASLTLVSARPVAPGSVDPNPPDHAPETTEQLFGRPEPDCTDGAGVVDCGNGLSLPGLRGPRNNFGLLPAPQYLFIAGGIGIMPLLP